MIRRIYAPHAIPPGGIITGHQAVQQTGIGLRQGLVFHWNGRRASSSRAYGQGRGFGASTGYRDAVLTGANASWGVGRYGPAMTFTGGATSFFDCTTNIDTAATTSILNQLGGNFAISLWFRADAIGTAITMWGESRTDNTGIFFFYLQASGVPTFQFHNGTVFRVLAGPTAMVAGRWYHVVGVMDKDGGSGSFLYVDGCLVATIAQTDIQVGGNQAFIGAAPNGGGTATQLPFNGAIDMVTIWSRPLAAPEVVRLYGNPMALFGSCRDPLRIGAPPPAATGDASITFGAMTVAGVGAVVDPATGGASITFGALTVAGAGSVVDPTTGDASLTFDPMTAAGAGTVLDPVTGDAGITFDPMTVLGDGAFILVAVGDADITFDPMTVAGEGMLVDPTVGVGTVTFDPMTAAAAGSVLVPVEGEADITFDPMTVSSLGASVGPSNVVEFPEALPAPLLAYKDQQVTRSLQTQMDSGRIRVRRKFVKEMVILQVQWNFVEDQYELFENFFKVDLQNGALSFVLVTFEPSPTPYMVRRIVRILAFHEGGQYNLGHSDNLYAVSAQLIETEKGVFEEADPFNPAPLIPPIINPPRISISYPECREYADVSCPVTVGFVYALQISDGEDGAYYDHIYIKPEETGTKVLRLNNDYRGEAWFRLVRLVDSAVVRKPRLMTASEVAPPGLSILNVALSPPSRGLWSDGVFIFAINEEINPYINNNPWYLVPRGRYEWETGIGSPSPVVYNNQVTFSDEPGSVTVFTRDGSDPQEDGIMRSLDGIIRNAAAYREDFAYIIKARSFKDGCPSPITCLLVDKKKWENPWTYSHGVDGGVSAACDLPRIDEIREDWTRDFFGPNPDNVNVHVSGLGTFVFDKFPFVEGFVAHEFLSGANCGTLYPTGLVNDLLNLATGMANPSNSRTYFYSQVATESAGGFLSFFGIGEGGVHRTGYLWIHASVSKFKVTDWQWDRSSNWNLRPICFDNGILATSDLALELYYPVNGHVSGPLGTTAGVYDVIAAALESKASFYWNNRIYTTLTYNFYVLSTAHNDASFPIPANTTYTPPEPPPEPEPVIIPVDGDDFELYADTTDATVPTLNAGDGFSGAWVIEDIIAGIGAEPWDDYEVAEIEDGAIVSGGQGWGGDWVFRVGYFSQTGTETFTGYDDGEYRGLNGGTLWDGAWEIRTSPFATGPDNFSDYADLSGDLLWLDEVGGSDLWTGGWVVRTSPDAVGGDDFEGYFADTDPWSQFLGLGTGWKDASRAVVLQLNFPVIPAGGSVEIAREVSGATFTDNLAPLWPTLPPGITPTALIADLNFLTIRLTNSTGSNIDPDVLEYAVVVGEPLMEAWVITTIP